MDFVQYAVNRSKEYDAFGPWIYEIDEEHEVPKLFIEHLNKKEAPMMMFKVPRSIERRNAYPNMDLYDYLIGAYETHLHILKKHRIGVKETRVYYKDIHAIKDVHALLKGELIIFTDELVVIDYNTVSEHIISKLINLVVNKKTSAGIRQQTWESMPAEYSPHNEKKLDMLLFNLFSKLKQMYPEYELIAYQPKAYVDGKTKIAKAGKRSVSKTAFISDGRQLIILERETPKKRKGKEEIAYSFLYLPLKGITGIRAQALDDKRLFYNLKITLNNHSFDYIFQRENKRIWEIIKKLEAV